MSGVIFNFGTATASFAPMDENLVSIGFQESSDGDYFEISPKSALK